MTDCYPVVGNSNQIYPHGLIVTLFCSESLQQRCKYQGGHSGTRDWQGATLALDCIAQLLLEFGYTDDEARRLIQITREGRCWQTQRPKNAREIEVVAAQMYKISEELHEIQEKWFRRRAAKGIDEDDRKKAEDIRRCIDKILNLRLPLDEIVRYDIDQALDLIPSSTIMAEAMDFMDSEGERTSDADDPS